MVTVQLIAKSNFLVRGKLVPQTDARGLPHMRAVGPWLPLRPPAVVQWRGWEGDRAGCTCAQHPLHPRDKLREQRGVHGPPPGQHMSPILPLPGLVAEPWAASALGSPPLSYVPFITFFAILHGGAFLLPPAPQSNDPEPCGEYSSWIIHCSSGKSLSSCVLSVSEHRKGRNTL